MKSFRVSGSQHVSRDPNMGCLKNLLGCLVLREKMIAFQLFVFYNVQLLHIDEAKGEMGSQVTFVLPNFFKSEFSIQKKYQKIC